MSLFWAEWFVALQRLTPQHGLSRLGARLAESRQPHLKNTLIRQFIRTYQVNMDEAASADLDDYPCFNDFFTRALKPDARPIASEEHSIVSPVDGTVSQLGAISTGRIFQAKGKSFTVEALLGADDVDSRRFHNGRFITIYLSPSDYHRVHMPVAGELDYCRYIPGKLFSVNASTTTLVDGLFAKNERLVCLFDTPVGRCAVVLVGAMMVAGIESVWERHYQANTLRHDNFNQGEVTLDKGQEMGRFKFGSTAILLFEPNVLDWAETLSCGSTVQMGEAIGKQLRD
ncbi:MAG: phosphatidylserine decarboxylase [Gammaproteobacteria bacterium]|nr:MAG: phosphatidylserine decarboxylase [Gammaproteobacteria bacterium]